MIKLLKEKYFKFKNRHDPFYQAWSNQNDEALVSMVMENEANFFENNHFVHNFIISLVPLLLDKTFNFIINHPKCNFSSEELKHIVDVLSTNIPKTFEKKSIIQDKNEKDKKFTSMITTFSNKYPKEFNYQTLKSMILTYTSVEAVCVIVKNVFPELSVREKVEIIHGVHTLLIPTTTDKKYNLDIIKYSLDSTSEFNMNYQAKLCQYIRENNLLVSEDFVLSQEEYHTEELSALMTDLILDTVGYRKMMQMKKPLEIFQEPIALVKDIIHSNVIDINTLKIIRNTNPSAETPQLNDIWDDLIRPAIEKSFQRKI